jgi:hypothetical protein
MFSDLSHIQISRVYVMHLYLFSLSAVKVNEVRLWLQTAATNGPLVQAPYDIYEYGEAW